MRYLFAFDKFKDSMPATLACRSAAEGIVGETDCCPLSDGGDGFAAILTGALEGDLTQLAVTGPRGDRVEAQLGLVLAESIPDSVRNMLGIPLRSGQRLAVIDMASASGLSYLRPEQRDPWKSTSIGTGELIRAATDSGAAAIVLGLGGSATHDLGLGALTALGYNTLGEDNVPVGPEPASWSRLHHLVGSGPGALPPIRLACDVTNPLLGAKGAVACYAPQKGLLPKDAQELERITAHAAEVTCARFLKDTLKETLAPGAGAAGGMAFGLSVALGAKIVPGAELVFAWLGIDRRLQMADIVVTGEGRFDQTSLSGKGPGAVIRRALAMGKPVHVFAGAIDLSGLDRIPPGVQLHVISPTGMPLEMALQQAPELMTKAVRDALCSQ